MWIYDQQTGKLSNDVLSFDAYSGHGDGLNNPALDDVHDVGPIPRGTYVIGSFFNDDEKGPFVAHLIPTEQTDTHGRSGFLLHGDNSQQDKSASHGCIIAPHYARVAIHSSNDTLLKVV